MDRPGAALGLAVSGGGDSLALLLLAHAALPSRVKAATVDHGLRAESADEADRVARYCAELGIAHTTLTVSVERGNTQEQARKARYAALGDWAEENDVDALATAHQMDDQAETFLMRLNRGSGLAGLSAIRALGSVPSAPVGLVRPLLRWRRNELAAIVERFGWSAVDDPSNHDDRYDRVRMRRALAECDWLDISAIEKSAGFLAEANDAIEWMVGREYAECVTPVDDAVCYAALRTGVSHGLIRAGVIRTIYRRFGKSIGQGDAAELADSLAAGRKSNVGGLQAHVEDRGGECLWVFRPEIPRRTG